MLEGSPAAAAGLALQLPIVSLEVSFFTRLAKLDLPWLPVRAVRSAPALGQLAQPLWIIIPYR